MTSVANILGGYYPLSGAQSGFSGAGSAAVPSLADALAAVSDGGSSSGDSNAAYSLNLSPQAQQLLNGGASGSDTSTTFRLSFSQQSTITSILAKYKDAPFTQATFDQIQDDLKAAGLGTDQLALQDKVTSFNPTSVLIDALSGNITDPVTQNATSDTAEQTKSNNYINSILSQWQSMSTAASSSSASAA